MWGGPPAAEGPWLSLKCRGQRTKQETRPRFSLRHEELGQVGWGAPSMPGPWHCERPGLSGAPEERVSGRAGLDERTTQPRAPTSRQAEWDLGAGLRRAAERWALGSLSSALSQWQPVPPTGSAGSVWPDLFHIFSTEVRVADDKAKSLNFQVNHTHPLAAPSAASAEGPPTGRSPGPGLRGSAHLRGSRTMHSLSQPRRAVSYETLLVSPVPHPFPPCPLLWPFETPQQEAVWATASRVYPKATPNLSHLLPGLSTSGRNCSGNRPLREPRPQERPQPCPSRGVGGPYLAESRGAKGPMSYAL